MKAFKKDFCFTLVCEGVYILVLWNLIPFVYGIIDDRSMMEIVSGQYLGMPDRTQFLWVLVFSLFDGTVYGASQCGLVCVLLHRDAGDVYDPDPVPAGERTGEEMGESIVRGAGIVVICGVRRTGDCPAVFHYNSRGIGRDGCFSCTRRRRN